MSRDLIAIGVLVAFGLVWMFANTKIRTQPGKFVSFLLMWTFLIAASIQAARFVGWLS